MRSILFASLIVSSLVACGSSGNNSPTADAPAKVVDGSTVDGTPIAGTKYSLTWGSVTVQPGQEVTQCVVLKLGNTSEIKVHQIHNTLSAATHHVIVYKDNKDTAESITPTQCNPFAGALDATGNVAPFMISQKKDDLLTLPDGVAYTLAPNQLIRIEMHYINSGDTPLVATETSDFYAVDASTIQNEADIVFAGSLDIDIPAHTTQTVHKFFQPKSYEKWLGGKFFAMTGHVHKLGLDVVVKTGTSSTDPSMVTVYNPPSFLWSEPPTVVQSPEFVLPAGGGFDFTCTYDNTTDAQVTFGESANQEMCFFWAYYYPSQGARVCLELDGASGCCPAIDPTDLATVALCKYAN